MIRVVAVWLATESLDLRAGMESVLNRVVRGFDAARPHHAYLFRNRHANRIKVLVHVGSACGSRHGGSTRAASFGLIRVAAR